MKGVRHLSRQQTNDHTGRVTDRVCTGTTKVSSRSRRVWYSLISHLEAGKDFRQGSDWVIFFAFLRIFMSVLWGIDWREEWRQRDGYG